MALDSPNSQFGADVEHKSLDLGMPAWAVKPGPAAVDPIPLVPGSVVASENFDDGVAFGGLINLVSNTGWTISSLSANSAPNSFWSSNSAGVHSFVINDLSFSPQLSFWARNNIPSGFSQSGLQVFFDGVLKLDLFEVPANTWTRYAFPTNFAFNIEFRFTRAVAPVTAQAFVDDIVFGSLDTPAVPGAPAHPLVYAPLQLNSSGRLLTDTVIGNSTAQLVPVKDDMDSFEAFHQTLSADTDTTVTFSQEVRMIRVSNWDTNDRVLIKDGAITSNTTSGAARIGFAPAASIPAQMWFPFRSTSIHLRCANSAEVTVEGYF